jgi:hypothetical protein
MIVIVCECIQREMEFTEIITVVIIESKTSDIKIISPLITNSFKLTQMTPYIYINVRKMILFFIGAYSGLCLTF